MDHVITVFLLVAGYILFVLVSPVGKCHRCRGRRVARRGLRFTRCRRCKGTGRAPRPGAALIHRTAREHAWPWLRDRIAARLDSKEEEP